MVDVNVDVLEVVNAAVLGTSTCTWRMVVKCACSRDYGCGVPSPRRTQPPHVCVKSWVGITDMCMRVWIRV
jgi:hypothetical protein